MGIGQLATGSGTAEGLAAIDDWARRRVDSRGSASATASAARLNSVPASAVTRTPKTGSSRLPTNAPRVMPTLKAVDVPAAARSELPGATSRTRAPRPADRAARAKPETQTDMIVTI